MSKKAFVRLMVLVMCMCLLFVTMSGCGEKPSGKPTVEEQTKQEDDKQTEQKAEGQTEQKSEDTPQAVARPEFMEITRTLYFGDATDNPDLKEEWCKAFEEKFGIKIKVNSPPRNEYLQKVNLMVASGELKGLVNLFTPNDVLKYKDDGVIEPLDEYIKDNAVWNSMPDGFKELHEYDGQVWAIAMGYSGNYFTRAIRKDWLDKLGLKVPETVDELYEVARAFTLDDPDGNGQDDTVGLVSAGTWNLQDIFQAFGARLNNVGGNSIAWDPNEDAWVDSMLKPGMVDALNYLADMYKNGYLDREVFTNSGSQMREKFLSGKYGSTFYWSMWGYSSEPQIQKSIPDAKVIEVVGLKGTVTQNLNQVVTTGAPYVLIKGTPQPKEVVNAFLDIFFGDKLGHFMGRLGIENKTFKFVDDNTIYTLKDPGTGQGYAQPGIVSEIPRFGSDKITIIPDGTEEEKQRSIEMANIKKKMTEEGFASKILFECPGKMDVLLSDKYTEVSADVNRIFNDTVVKVVTGEMKAEDAIAEYRKQMKAIGGDIILQEANAAIGRQAKQTY